MGSVLWRRARSKAAAWIVPVGVGAAVLAAPLGAQQPQQPQRPATFRAGTDLVRVDVVVRDKNGAVVRGLKAADFVVQEDGKPQQITSFDFEEISTAALPLAAAPALLGVQQLQAAAAAGVTIAPAAGRGAPPSAESGAATVQAQGGPEASESAKSETAGRRLIILLFDTSSMQPEEVDRAVKSAHQYVDAQMSAADLVSVVTVGQSLTVLHDFTGEREALNSTLGSLDATSGTGFEQPVAADLSDVSSDTDPADLPLDDSEFGIFNNDRRLRAMRVLCEALAPIEQKKALMYFSGGMSRSGSDNEVELRAVTNACNRANTSIYTVDSRGLAAVVPGGAAGGGGGRGGGGRGGAAGSSVFSGRSMLNQFASLNSSQETLTTLAADTGGQAFLDTNDFAPAFTRVQRDMSAYYLLGYRTTNTSKDGKFRKISVRLKDTASGYRLEARTGYYAEADFAHLDKNNRERQLLDQIASPVSATDVPVVAATSWFRVSNDRFYVPVSIAVPGSSVPVTPAKPGAAAPAANDTKPVASLDLLGIVSDEQGRTVGRIRDTMQIPANQAAELATKQLQYQSGVTLPGGHFKVKVAVRENTNGSMGTFEFPIAIPDLKGEPLKVSPIVLSTQLRFARGGGPGRGRGGPGGFGPGGPGGAGGFGGGAGGGFGGPPINSARGGGALFGDQSPNPLLRNGQEIVQSLTHLVLKNQQMYFYYEVYDPPVDSSGAPKLTTSLAFYRGRVKVFETPVVQKTAIDDADRHAAIFQLALPAGSFKPGLYTCQVNVIDEATGKFAFPRIALYVKDTAVVK
jgi:VWFA-related protein